MAKKLATILIADDSEPDRALIRRAVKTGKFNCELQEVEDGEKLIMFLKNEPPYEDKNQFTLPDLLLLDINMPRVDGKQALKIIRNELKLRSLPIIILTTSSRESDIIESYNLGVNAFVTKPVKSAAFFEAITKIENFWLDLVTLPKER